MEKQEIINEYEAAMFAANESGYAGMTAERVIRNLVERAEAAEAKLAEVKAQRDDFEKSALYSAATNKRLVEKLDSITRPAPAADLSELVPDSKPKPEPGTHVSAFTHWHDGWNACRAEILRNIEEVTLKTTNR